MPERAAPPSPPTIPAPSASGLAACLLALVGEAQSLSHPFAAHLIAAAAADLLEADKPAPTGTTPTGATPTPTQAAR
jgi:hypothetical protein